MGTCTSAQKDSDSAMRCRLGLAHKVKRFFILSPAKERPLHGEKPLKPVAQYDLRSPQFGSKEEIFFDSRAWLDSDNEDDFFSVNGEFTPSQGSTPNHQTSSPLSPQLNNFIRDKDQDSNKSEPSPTGRKKLADLLLETSQSERVDDVPNAVEDGADINVNLDTHKSINSASSVGSSEGTPSRDLKNRKEKTWKTGHCCLPISLQNFGMSPGPCTV